MFKLYHLWLSPFSRKVRLLLEEKKIDYDMIVEKTWERNPDFIKINPACEVPVLVDSHDKKIIGVYAICEYLEEKFPTYSFMGTTAEERSEIRRLQEWFDRKFDEEVTSYLVRERIMKRFLRLGQPNTQAIKAACQNIKYHLDYVSWLVDRRDWLAGEQMTLADISAAAQLSCVDYLGDVPWDHFPTAKIWYSRVKSRPSFRSILEDYIPGSPPSSNYKNLDF